MHQILEDVLSSQAYYILSRFHHGLHITSNLYKSSKFSQKGSQDFSWNKKKIIRKKERNWNLIYIYLQQVLAKGLVQLKYFTARSSGIDTSLVHFPLPWICCVMTVNIQVDTYEPPGSFGQ